MLTHSPRDYFLLECGSWHVKKLKTGYIGLSETLFLFPYIFTKDLPLQVFNILYLPLLLYLDT